MILETLAFAAVAGIAGYVRFRKPTVEGAIAGLNGTLDNLRKAEEHALAKAEKLAAKAEKLVTRGKTATEVATKASGIAANLHTLLNPTPESK